MSDTVRAADIDRAFDAGEDVTGYFDMEHPLVTEGARQTKRVNVDFPVWMVEQLDREANRLAVTRQAIIKMWIGERLDSECAKRGRPSESA